MAQQSCRHRCIHWWCPNWTAFMFSYNRIAYQQLIKNFLNPWPVPCKALTQLTKGIVLCRFENYSKDQSSACWEILTDWMAATTRTSTNGPVILCMEHALKSHNREMELIKINQSLHLSTQFESNGVVCLWSFVRLQGSIWNSLFLVMRREYLLDDQCLPSQIKLPTSHLGVNQPFSNFLKPRRIFSFLFFCINRE